MTKAEKSLLNKYRDGNKVTLWRVVDRNVAI